MEEGARDLSARRGPGARAGYDEDEEWIVHARDRVLDEAADLARIEIAEACDLGGGLPFVIHGVDEVALALGEQVGSGQDVLGEGVGARLSEIDGG